MKKVTSLREIPGALFGEFCLSDTQRQFQSFESFAGMHHVAVGYAYHKDPRAEYPHTLVLRDFIDSNGRDHRTELFVCRENASPEDFSPEPPKERFVCPILRIKFFSHMPILEKEDYSWESGKGFWVPEFLCVDFGVQCGLTRSQSISGDSNPEFRFLLKILIEMEELERIAKRKHHWECEWRDGDYTEAPRRSHHH